MLTGAAHFGERRTDASLCGLHVVTDSIVRGVAEHRAGPTDAETGLIQRRGPPFAQRARGVRLDALSEVGAGDQQSLAQCLVGDAVIDALSYH
jgi:hypothetical protein